MDQQGTYDRWDSELPWDSTATNANGAVNLRLASDLYIEALACPNDDSGFAVPGGLTYVANGGFAERLVGADAATQDEGHTFFTAKLDWNSNNTVSLADTEDHDLTFKTGVFWAHFTNTTPIANICSNKCTAPGKIYDGSANTIMLSENINAGLTNWANPSVASCAFVYPLEGGGSNPSDTTRHPRRCWQTHQPV